MDKKLPKGLTNSLEQGEEILYMVKKRFAVEKPKWLIVTSNRVIIFDEKILGRYELKAIPYEKLEKIVYHGGIIGSKFYIVLENNERIEMTWMDKEESKKAITAIYEALKMISIEPPSLNKKKNLASEDWVLNKPKELVARSARGVTANGQRNVDSNGLALLKKLRELRDAGVISNDEYESKKSSILSKL